MGLGMVHKLLTSSNQTTAFQWNKSEKCKRYALQPSCVCNQMMQNCRIVIIGAGVAGLACARALTNSFGFTDVVILEVLYSLQQHFNFAPTGKRSDWRSYLHLRFSWSTCGRGCILYSWPYKVDLFVQCLLLTDYVAEILCMVCLRSLSWKEVMEDWGVFSLVPCHILPFVNLFGSPEYYDYDGQPIPLTNSIFQVEKVPQYNKILYWLPTW
jgi:hypothetical protein